MTFIISYVITEIFSPRLTFHLRGTEVRIHHSGLALVLVFFVTVGIVIILLLGWGDKIILKGSDVIFFLGMILGALLHDVWLHNKENNK